MNTHRTFWEPSSPATSENVISNVEKKHFGKITVTESAVDGKHLIFTDDIKEPLFGNPTLQNRLSKELSLQLSRYFKKYKLKKSSLILVAGIGNESITADSLGCKVCDGLYATSHFYSETNSETLGNLAYVKCGVGGITGVESYLHLSAVCEKMKPSAIIVVDTLAANTPERLSSSLQLSDRGLEPGKGVGNDKKELTAFTLSCPVIAIGVPLVIYAQKIIAYLCKENDFAPKKSSEKINNLIVASKDVDFLIKDFAKVISDGINSAVHGIETA